MEEENKFSNAFYIWFNHTDMMEYYVTPRYKLDSAYDDIRELLRKQGVDENDPRLKKDDDSRARYQKMSWFVPNSEKIGEFFMKFLNTNFLDFETAYNDFYYYYGFEFLFIYSNKIKQFNIKDNRVSKEELELLHNDVVENIISIQKDYRDIVEFIYKLDEKYKKEYYSPQVKFAACIAKKKTKLFKYANNFDILNIEYTNFIFNYKEKNFQETLKILSNKSNLLNTSYLFTSNYLEGICYATLHQLIEYNLSVKKCQHCGRYFIPNKLNEIYCDRIYSDGKTCRELGALETYKKNLESNQGLLEYRRIYNKISNRIARNKDDKKMKDDFDKWKILAQIEVKKFKNGEITEQELIDWMSKNQ